ncbi:hypothetical protein AMS68_007418 [Peltaster fructicola]|uniref:BTB domain-containing protein n=1 Tax=Peltaster fructicola TaxID=286661 RepID=A0A6H0Y4Q7_9PEZI|nr:hypothetical protein AMS68_007418 [Peltaster fructicola]
MSSLLWTAYYEDDVDTFRQLLETPANTKHGRGGLSTHVGSPGVATALASSPIMSHKSRKTAYGTPNNGQPISRTDINTRDSNGLSILHHVASSKSETAIAYAASLLEHAYIDLYLQDHENGWTALHRAFYFGNISIARMILEREAHDVLGPRINHTHGTTGLIKIKDREGHGPLDLYAATIKDRTLRPEDEILHKARSVATDDDDEQQHIGPSAFEPLAVGGDEVYTFGSNRNVTLGFGDEDDRQFPERIVLRRPEALIRRFHREHIARLEKKWAAYDHDFEKEGIDMPVPWNVKTIPLTVQDVHMSKLHTAVLTSDPESNLYVCGHGQGGRLGTGDERTRYQFVCIDSGVLAGRKIATVALGQNHTLALSDDGSIFSWGNNGFGQLGYSLPRSTTRDEDPVSLEPRQIFGPLKRESIAGIAASRTHSVAFTGSSLYTFGKNDGQLGIVDSDARSLEVQVIPRKVAASLFSDSIAAVTCIDKATICLLENHEVWIFANYGYSKVSFPLEGFTNFFLKESFLLTRYDHSPNRIVKVTAGGDTVCALSSRGEIFTVSISRHDTQVSSSTTNPAKIRSAITTPQCIWSLKRGNMAARDVGVDADGSIILSTEEGSVWKRTKRAHMKDASITAGDYRPKDYKFSRIPGLTRVLAVRASAYGSYAAVRRDCDVTKTQVVVESPSLWKDISALSPLKQLGEPRPGDHESRLRFWQSAKPHDTLREIKKSLIESKDVEADLRDICERLLSKTSMKYDAVLATSTSEVHIPIHRWLLTGRSRAMRRGFRDLCETSTFTIPDLCISELDNAGRAIIRFAGLDILTIIDLALYLYTDAIVDFWHIRNAKENAYRYRQVRVELMKIASKLELNNLEPAVRQMIEPKACLDMDLAMAIVDPVFFYDGDTIVQLEDGEMEVHSALVCARCPFFEGLFGGRAAGRWLAGREAEKIRVDLAHINKATFNFVLQDIYAGTGEEVFDHLVAADLDGYIDIVLDVLSAANELMLDRLSQVCQSAIGKCVNARNACWLLNAISPSSVHEFKHAALEYLCLNLEAMMQGHHLNELEEDLLQELDEVVRQNQLNCMPFAKSERAELDLHERHPGLAEMIDRNKRAKVDAIRLRSKFQELMAFKPGSVDDDHEQMSPMQSKSRRRSSNHVKHDADRPQLKPKASSKDMMFVMDEESDRSFRSPTQSPAMRPVTTPRLDASLATSPPEEQWYNSRGKLLASPTLSAQRSPMVLPQLDSSVSGTPRTPRSPMLGGKTPPNGASPWSLTPLPAARSDFRNIMAQASGSGTSSLSQGLEGARSLSYQAPILGSSPMVKMSQKDRKKMLHQQSSPEVPSIAPSASTSSPWQIVSSQKVPSLRDVLDTQKSTASKPPQTTRTATAPQLTMRQTVANAKAITPARNLPIPPTKQAIQQRHASDGKVASPVQTINSKPMPHSVRHAARPVEPSLQLSISDIVAQQQLEKEIIKEAGAKRDLQEIQAEQEFQEWWNKESARVQEAERTANAPPRAPRKIRQRGGRGAGKGPKGKAEANALKG